MKKVITITFFLLVIYNFSYSQNEYLNSYTPTKLIRTSAVIQDWGIDGIDDHISEFSLPIEVIWPINDKFNLNIFNSPAVSSFGDNSINGISDTWIRAIYKYNNNTVFSCGIGIPTGNSKLTSKEYTLSRFLNLNMFKFQLPLYGQGLTLSNGIISAYPINEKLVIGGGINYVYRGKYQYIDELDQKFNPGDNIGLNLGVDYYYSDRINLNLDLLYTYYTNDKLNDISVFGAAAKTIAKFGFNYLSSKHIVWAILRYRISGKNETWDGSTLITEPQNTNVVEREFEAMYQMNLTNSYAINVLLDVRSYVENEYGLGQADIFGGGIGGIVQIMPDLKLNVLFKLFVGDGNFITTNIINKTIYSFSGIEFKVISEYRF